MYFKPAIIVNFLCGSLHRTECSMCLASTIVDCFVLEAFREHRDESRDYCAIILK